MIGVPCDDCTKDNCDDCPLIKTKEKVTNEN